MARERLTFPEHLYDFSCQHALPEYMMVRVALHDACVFFLCLLRFPYEHGVRLVTLISLVILLIALDMEFVWRIVQCVHNECHK